MKRLPAVLALVLSFGVAAVCVGLGLWQLRRLEEKQALNTRLRQALTAAPVALSAADALVARGAPADSLRLLRFEARGHYDETHQFLLMGRAHEGDPGVEVVTPLVPDDGGPAVLVNRGWVPAIDAVTARPEEYPVPGPQVVVGLAERLAHGGRATPFHRIEIDTLDVWSAARLDADSITTRLPYPVRPYALRALPDASDSAAATGGATAPARTIRSPARPYDETMHRSYAAQWFSFAAIFVIGSLVLVFKPRKAPQ